MPPAETHPDNSRDPDCSSWQIRLYTYCRAANFTFDVDHGGFSTTNLLTIDQRGFARLVQEEAAGFIQENQVLLNATVTDVEHSLDGVTVALADGRRLSADYALVTFSLGVLQNDDVRFVPPLPDWKVEAIHGMTMVSPAH